MYENYRLSGCYGKTFIALPNSQFGLCGGFLQHNQK